MRGEQERGEVGENLLVPASLVSQLICAVFFHPLRVDRCHWLPVGISVLVDTGWGMLNLHDAHDIARPSCVRYRDAITRRGQLNEIINAQREAPLIGRHLDNPSLDHAVVVAPECFLRSS
jgi:hypothetical protein